MTVHNDCPKCISDSHYVQSLWTVIKTVLFFIMTVQNDCPFCEMKISSHKNVRPLFIVKSEFLGYNVIMTRCSRHTGFNVRPRATKTVLGLRLLRSLQSSDSFGGTRADIKPSMPRAAGSLYPKMNHKINLPVLHY